MIPRRAHKADLFVFVGCCLIGMFYFGYEMGFRSGYQNTPVKKCAEVRGLKPISTTVDTCTYVQARMLATYKKGAI
jgi:hypothetical protein